jgi:hypothetical protein
MGGGTGTLQYQGRSYPFKMNTPTTQSVAGLPPSGSVISEQPAIPSTAAARTALSDSTVGRKGALCHIGKIFCILWR